MTGPAGPLGHGSRYPFGLDVMDATAIEESILTMLHIIDAPDDPFGHLGVLRSRLLGELFGDARPVAETLAPEFELVVHAGGMTTTATRDAVVRTVEHQSATGVFTWVELRDIVASEDRIAGQGAFLSLSPERSLTRFPLAFFIRYVNGLMTSEVAFMETGAADTIEVADEEMPAVGRLRTLVATRGR